MTSEPLVNCHLTDKKMPKTWQFFLKKMKMFGNFFGKMSSFWQFFDSQMATFRRVSWAWYRQFTQNPGVRPRRLWLAHGRTLGFCACYLVVLHLGLLVQKPVASGNAFFFIKPGVRSLSSQKFPFFHYYNYTFVFVLIVSFREEKGGVFSTLIRVLK